ncbi:NUDIX domain-containing protein, partial [Nocardia brasiliensis]|uniref:NUDIX domain-containing protein n=1 Tax=Nocardia brasiliensis TaxID=37326 RepID=UPI002454CDC7
CRSGHGLSKPASVNTPPGRGRGTNKTKPPAPPAAAVREANEEIGVHIDPADLRHVHTAHVIGSGHEPRLGLFFEVRTWRGELANREPDKCYELRWFPLDDLPADIIAYPTAGISALSTGATYSERGWNAEK